VAAEFAEGRAKKSGSLDYTRCLRGNFEHFDVRCLYLKTSRGTNIVNIDQSIMYSQGTSRCWCIELMQFGCEREWSQQGNSRANKNIVHPRTSYPSHRSWVLTNKV